MISTELLDRLANTGAELTLPAGSTVPGGHLPDWVLEPESVAQLTALVRILHEGGVAWRVDARGRNWGYDDSRVCEPGLLIRLARLDRLHLDVELGLATVQPGVTFAQLAEALRRADARFQLPAPGSGPHTSVLGNALERGLLAGLSEREHYCRDFLVLHRDGELTRLGWADAANDRIRRALPYPPGPHAQGSLFQAGGYGPVVVELTHVLPVATAHTTTLVLLAGHEPTEDLLRCWRDLLLEELVTSTILTSPARRRAQGITVGHDGPVLDLCVSAGSPAMLRAKVLDVQRLARQHGQRLAGRLGGAGDDLGILGGDQNQPESVGQLPEGLEWHTATLPFAPSTVAAFARAVRADPVLTDVPWTLRPIDSRALVWLAPFVYRKEDSDSGALLRRRVAAVARLRHEFAVPAYRSGAVRGDQ
ncbi:FAD-binding protein [Micromonospora sp. WMMD1082]|uniref:FAD-binding oxidoreductase n=1 Tax=Micromonospora sp. WMMD1082 TaxID=3016104 RepID=UPI0024169FDD|nr:FAD-binding protein [Micromonospora sp. WMMD1082]MDG4796330.1 FAD-binding protein [Micromonospora sp. WMMD1082]